MPYDANEAWRTLGQQLAAHRKAAGFTQETLAAHDRIHYGRSTIANVERGRQLIGREFWRTCDSVLGADGDLARQYDEITRAIASKRIKAVSSVRWSTEVETVAPVYDRPVAAIRSAAFLRAVGGAGTDAVSLDASHHLLMPPGRALLGVTIPADLHPAIHGEQVVTHVPGAYAESPFLNRPGRALVVGQVERPDQAVFVMDSRYARRRLRGAGRDARLSIPRAYLLDDLTMALLWAVASFDDALLADDAIIAASMADSTGYAAMAKSAASRDLAVDATPASRLWIGSQFCASHIRRNAPRLTDTPVFWTREQRGEEAATWLLFAHKHEYLRETSNDLRADSSAVITRAFCIPEDAVTGSPLGERALLLLAIALMESYGVQTAVTDAPELAGTAGFVTDRRRQAITATWVGADGIWYVDLADDRNTLRNYADAAGYAINHSVIAAPSAHDRLRNLSGYLGLDWTWLTTRCTELAERGTAEIAEPRSRLLSLAGVDRACQFVAESGRRAD